MIDFHDAIGTAYISRTLLSPKFEQVFYAVFLAMIAGFYLAFTVYFGSEQAWRVESTAVLCFALIALAGIRLPSALITGYVLHGLWDVIHELHAHAELSVFEPGQTTAIPLAYGAFCANGRILLHPARSLECRLPRRHTNRRQLSRGSGRVSALVTRPAASSGLACRGQPWGNRFSFPPEQSPPRQPDLLSSQRL
jgi:hypothetical protein